MKLAKVIGTVVASQKVESFEGKKILMIQPLDGELKNAGTPIAALDITQAGLGELVHFTLSRESAFAFPDNVMPVDAVVTGIVDGHNVEKKGGK